jgi:TRAP transporter TAXI family solute receptor
MKSKPFILIITMLLLSAPISFAAEQATILPDQVAAPLPEKIKVDPKVDDKLIVIGSGNISGVYYPTSGAICRLFNSLKLPSGARCAVESTDGSVYNIEALRKGDIEFAMVQSDVQRHAYEATGAFQNMQRFENLRFVFSLHNEAITIVAKKGSGIEDLDDLNGKTVNIGSQGSSMRKIFENIMRIKGWTLQSFKGVTEYAPDQQATMLCKGEIDAMILVSGHPNGAMQDASSRCEVQIIELVGTEIEKFVQDNPEFSFSIIPGGMYLGIAKNMRSIGTRATLLTTNEISEEAVYNLTKAVFSQLDKFKKMYPVLASLDPKQMVTEGQTASMHPGARRYFVEAKLIAN